MLAVPSELPADPERYAFEYKWDGVRAVCFWDGATLRLQSRNLLDITTAYPELRALGAALGRRPMVLDGEVVSLGDDGAPSFAALQRRMHVRDPRAAARLAREAPVWLVLFDLLYDRGEWLLDLPYTKRRELLEARVAPGASWHVTPAHVGRGTAMLDAARAHGLEGVVAKTLDGPYLPGVRSPSWRKIKFVLRQEFVVGGWLAEGGGPAAPGSRIGAMLLGYHDRSGLRYAGRVGSGLRGADHQRLGRLLPAISRKTSPFVDDVPVAGVAFVEPRLVIEVEYRRWPPGGLIQHAAYKGIRTDKPAAEVTNESVTAPAG